jgi:integrative and conjugative element protein (TIGR02256 family)
MLRKPFAASAATLVAICVSMADAQAPSRSDLGRKLQLCRVPGVEEQVLCGKYEVREDRSDPQSRSISLNVVVLPAATDSVLPDPLVFLAGGGVVPATRYAGFLTRAFPALRRTRDVVLLDQRGTWGSNPLACPAPSGAPGSGTALPAMQQCRDSLSPRANLKAYTTPAAMQDLDDVREWLGYHMVNLYGVSYGTKAAQVYVKTHPDRVRAVVLYGVVPLSRPSQLDLARFAQSSLDTIFRRCAADAACHAAYPNVVAEFDAVLKRLSAEPVQVSIDGPGGTAVPMRITDRAVRDLVQAMLGSARGSSSIPLLVHQANLGDYVPIARALAGDGPPPLPAAPRGLFFSIICSEAIPQVRLEDVLPSAISQRSVLLLGCGALGGDVAVTLAKAGVGKLILVDPDVIVAGNVVRHVAGLAATGLSKPDAVRQLVYQHNPFVDVEAIPKYATYPREDLDSLLGRADLTVSTIADENVELIINEAAVRTGRTVIYGRALRSGTCGRIFRVRPGVDACKSCLSLYRDAAERGEATEWIVVPAAQGELLGRECGQPILAGSAVDLRIIADLTARALIDELGGEVQWNNLLWVRAPWPEPPQAVALPYTLVRESFDPRQDCPVCARPRGRSVALNVAAAASMRGYAEAKTTVETGGVLIGYEEGGVVHVMEVTDAGPQAEETPTRFRYDASYVNGKLRDAADRLGTRGLYLGEWHTHLEAQPTPSPRDIESLSEIAAAPNFLTDEPVMIISGLDPATGRVAAMHASAFPIHRGMRVLPLVES